MEQLIPFEQIATWGLPGVLVLLGLLAVSIVVLGKGADLLVEGAAQLAYRLRIPKIVVGATVVSLGTTTPEAATSVLSALQNMPGLALGNAMGSVICDTGLIFGLSCLITRLPVDRFILNRHGWLQFGSGILLAVLMLGSMLIYDTPQISRIMGLGLLILLALYMYISVIWARQHPSATDDGAVTGEAAWLLFGKVVLGITLVVLAAKVLIGSVEQLCLLLHVPEAVVAGTVVAFGTSLPELITAITSIRKGHPEILIGNVVGADILNILFVTGASASAVALDVEPVVLYIHLPAMLLILLLFRIFIAVSRHTFARWIGIPLLLVYGGYIVAAYRFAPSMLQH